MIKPNYSKPGKLVKPEKVATLPSKKKKKTPGEKAVARKRPAKRAYPEFVIQCTLAALLRQHYVELLWFAIPNGGRRAPRDAKRFKDMGVRRGVYDIFVSEPTPVYSGLYVEMKAPKGSLSDEQKDFRDMAQARGYKCVEATSAVDGLRLIEEYLGVPKAGRVSSLIVRKKAKTKSE
jgi:hypothetical protein